MLAALGTLGGCSTFALSPGAVSLSNTAEPFPHDYVALAQRHFGIKRQPNLQISRPSSLIGAGVMDPQRWYVCVRQPRDQQTVVLVISGGEITGAVVSPAPNLCESGEYERLG